MTIKELLMGGIAGTNIAKLFNVTSTQISYIKNGKQWGHINI